MTNTQLIQELLKKTAVIEERLSNTIFEIKQLESDQAKITDWVIAIDRRLAILEENVKDLRKIADERDRRRFAVSPSVIGCLLTLAANLALTYLRLPK